MKKKDYYIETGLQGWWMDGKLHIYEHLFEIVSEIPNYWNANIYLNGKLLDVNELESDYYDYL